MKWSMISLGDIALRKGGSVDPKKYRGEVFELYSIPAFDAGVPEVVSGSAIGSPKKAVQPDDVMISRIVPHIRRACVVGPASRYRQIASGEWIIFRDERVWPKYLRWLLVGDVFHSAFMRTVSGVGGSLLRARPAEVFKIRIPLPPLPEQRRIAEILDKADALRSKRRAAIAHLHTFIQSIFLDMFGDPATNPKRWPMAVLRSLGRVTTGATPPSANEGMFDGAIPFITPGDLESDQPFKRTVTDAGARASRTVGPGATLVCCIGATIGKIGKSTVRSAFNQQINAVEWGERIHAEYGCEVMRFFKPTIVTWGSSTTLPILKKSLFERIEIPVPPVTDQQEFALRLERVERLRATLRVALSKSNELFSTLQAVAFGGGV